MLRLGSDFVWNGQSNGSASDAPTSICSMVRSVISSDCSAVRAFHWLADSPVVCCDAAFDGDVQQIGERTDTLNIEAQVMAAAALSGQSYGDVMAYAGEKARLLTAAQEDGRQITPELEAQIDALARSYAEAGRSAEDAADRLKKVQEAGKAGTEAVAGIFTAALEGADAAKQAVMQLIQQIIQVQIQKSLAGLAESGTGFLAGLGKLLSFDGGGHTGNGPRTGGVDGKGGFMAIMHPGERVYDETKGQRASSTGSQPAHVTVGVDPKTGNLTAFVDQRAVAIAQAASQRTL